MKNTVLLALLILAPTSAFAQSSAWSTLKFQPAPGGNSPPGRFKDFVDSAMFSFEPYVLAFGAAVIDEISNMPEEWVGGEGFAKRNLARLGSGFTSDAVGHSVAAVIGHRVMYVPCKCAGGGRRTTYALGQGFVTDDNSGRRVAHVSLFIAKFAAAGLANVWYPRSYTTSDIVREGFLGIGVNAGLNIFREFAPELLRLLPFG